MARLLLVEDNADLRALYRRWLGHLGHDLDEAESGEQALELMRRVPYDLVLLDVRLPGVAGWEVARKMAKTRELADIPVLIVTIVDPEDLPTDVRAAGWLTKPIAGEELREAVSGALAV
jgi:CheY-like chemotaxis protein